MSPLEESIVNKSELKQLYHFNKSGAWDSLRLIGITNKNHEYDNCYVCAILKCAKKLKTSVEAMYAIVLVSRNTYKLMLTVKQFPEERLVSWVLNNSVELGPSIIKLLNEDYTNHDLS